MAAIHDCALLAGVTHMALSIVRLGSPRLPHEGLRIGTVRRPPRGVPKAAFSSGNWYDVWLPELSPGADLIKLAQAARADAEWQQFFGAYRTQMNAPPQQHLIALLAAISQHSDLSVGCYCEDETHCHRSVLRDLLREAGASMRQP
jgi:uncharacterized protein YeaO (DUF488 family)